MRGFICYHNTTLDLLVLPSAFARASVLSWPLDQGLSGLLSRRHGVCFSRLGEASGEGTEQGTGFSAAATERQWCASVCVTCVDAHRHRPVAARVPSSLILGESCSRYMCAREVVRCFSLGIEKK